MYGVSPSPEDVICETMLSIGRLEYLLVFIGKEESGGAGVG